MDRLTLDSILDSYVTTDEYEVVMSGLLDAINSGDEREIRRALHDLGAVVGGALVEIPPASFLVKDIRGGDVWFEGACTDCKFSDYCLTKGGLNLTCIIDKSNPVEVSPFQAACKRYVDERVKP